MGIIGFEDSFTFLKKKEGEKAVFECSDEIGRLWGIEKMLEIASVKLGSIENIDFFEFGGAEYNIFNKIPKSGKASHFMMAGTDLSYSCFDSSIGESDFDLISEIVSLHKKIMSGDIDSSSAARFHECIDLYSKSCQKKDLPIPFVYEVFASEIKLLGLYYDLNLDFLKEEIEKSSCKTYLDISKKINDSKDSAIYSFNVLNAPSLSFESPFWNIKNGLHIHGVNEVELLANMGLSNYFNDGADRRGVFELGIDVKDFILRFKEMFSIDEEVSYEDGFFFWNSKKTL